MGYYVHIQVAFSCNDNEPLAEVARKYLPLIGEDVIEAKWYLTELSKRTGTNPGPKGGLSLWGMVGNYTHVDKFVETLRPFWHEILSESKGPLDFDHILVFEEREQTEQTTAYEIYLEEGDEGEKRGLIVKKHACPFCFNQF